MKGSALTLLFILLASAFSPCLLVAAEIGTVPHEDPASAQSMMDSLSFLVQYAEIFGLMSSRQYSNASQLSEQLSHITVPDDLSYIIKRYNDLTQQLITQLTDLENTLDRASNLIDQYRLDEARQELDHAGVVVAKAQIILNDLKDATLTVSQRLGVLAAPAESKIHQAYTELQRMLDRLRELIDLYHRLMDRANQRFEEIKNQNLKNTAITLALNASKCLVGGYLRASGALTSSGTGLANRAVTLYLDDVEVAKVNTQDNGSYHAIVRVPFKYVSSVSLKAVYSPESGDRGVYLGSTSPTVKVQVLFYDTLLEVSLPKIGNPGLPLPIEGNVTSEDGTPLEGRQVKVLLDGLLVSEQTTDGDGAFIMHPTVSSGAKLGAHTLTVRVDPRGVYAGVSLQRNLTVQKMPTTLEVTAPSYVTLPSKITINGTVKSAEHPLGDANITLDFAGLAVSTKTLLDGSFILSVDVPFNTVFAGYQTMHVTVHPSQPWQAGTDETVSVFVLNGVSIALALVASISVVLVLYFRFARSRGTKQHTLALSASSAEPQKETPDAVDVPSVSAVKFEGLKGQVLAAYVAALGSVQSCTGVKLLPNMTLREYLKTSVVKLGEAANAFSALTEFAERSLYSPFEPTDADVAEAERLADEIGRSLKDAAA